MRIFKKLFKRKEKKEKKAECWYNNAHELPAEKWVPTEEGGGPKNDNTMWYSTAQHAHKQS